MMRLKLADPAKAHRLDSWALETIEAEKDMTEVCAMLAAHKRNGPATVAKAELKGAEVC